jgi:hypothetical protein
MQRGIVESFHQRQRRCPGLLEVARPDKDLIHGDSTY